VRVLQDGTNTVRPVTASLNMIAQSSNRLLAALPADEYRRLMPELHTIHLRNGEGLPHCGETRVYFPERGICSVANVMDDGRMIEIATVGSEGVVGMSVLAGLHQLTRNSYMQIGDGCARFMLLDGAEQRAGPLGNAAAVDRPLFTRAARVDHPVGGLST
jgi:hypothetical protein